MKTGLLPVAFVILLAAGGYAQEKKAAPVPVTAELKWITGHVFEVPESALYDSVRDVIYVSNINGVPRQVDSNGYISKVKTDGTVEQLKWITALHGPKGMGIYGDKLYVADIYRLVEIDIPQGKIVNTYHLKATFLNDVAIDSAGTVYVSDNMANKIYRLKDGQTEMWREGELGGPNGLWAERSGLLYNAMSDGLVRKFGWDATDPVDWVKLPIGLDGITPCHDGYLVAVFDGEVYWVSSEGSATRILDTRSKNMQSADIEYIPKLNLLLVPTFSDNRLAAYQLTFK